MPFSFAWVLLCVLVKHKPLTAPQLWCSPLSTEKGHWVWEQLSPLDLFV